MSLSYAEREQFSEGLVARARRRGIVCGITSGMACVAFGVAQATKDCDLLCLVPPFINTLTFVAPHLAWG